MSWSFLVLFILVGCLISVIVAMDKDRNAKTFMLRIAKRKNVEHELHIKRLEKRLYTCTMQIKFLHQSINQGLKDGPTSKN